MNGAFAYAEFFCRTSDGGVCCGNILTQYDAAVLHVMAEVMVCNLPPIHFQNGYTPLFTTKAFVCTHIRRYTHFYFLSEIYRKNMFLQYLQTVLFL